eukprot:TRINITY_DN80716_c0_g1_i1.p1 TRINITY_DN80716_c0_g1~~TRINITY_DN80716_c0_g1_i1.p1  ORF type:complete len:283 (-),score=50.09 TRINITY_DN80716_c0_g1_i1:50-898(-)
MQIFMPPPMSIPAPRHWPQQAASAAGQIQAFAPAIASPTIGSQCAATTRTVQTVMRWNDAFSTARPGWDQVGPGREFATDEDFFMPAMDSWGGPYAEMMRFLLQHGFLEGLPLDSRGLLRVSAPFCGGFMECPTLPQFLSDNFIARQGVAGISILGTELESRLGGYWPQKERYVAKTFPGLVLQLRELDLTKQQLPECALSIGVHPEASRRDFWPVILANVFSSIMPGGVCVFATYFDIEVKGVLTAAEKAGLRLEVFENPYYKTHSLPDSPSARFILVGRR